MSLIGDVFSTGDGLTLSVSLVLLEIPDEPWIKASIINALNTMTIERNWAGDNGDITPEQAQQIASLMLQTIQFDYEPPDMTPIGMMVMFGAASPPANWLLCDGTAINRTTYASLFAVIGTTYGAGNGSTTFNLPNFKDRSPMMPGVGNVDSLGDQYGTDAVQLTIGQLPSHDHDYNDPGHFHDHIRAGGAAGAYTNVAGTTLSNPVNVAWPTQSKVTGITFHSQGSNQYHNNTHPVLGVNMIIYGGG